MTQVESQHSLDSVRDDYDPDDVGCSNSPLLEPVKVNLQPEAPKAFMVPLPPPMSLGSGAGLSDHKGNKKSSSIPSLSDAGLVAMMGNGRAPDVAHIAGTVVLTEDANMTDEDSSRNGVDVDLNMDGEDSESGSFEEEEELPTNGLEKEKVMEENKSQISIAQSLAATAARAVEVMQNIPKSTSPRSPKPIKMRDEKRIGEDIRRVSISSAAIEGRPKIPSIFVGNVRPSSHGSAGSARIDPMSPGSEGQLPPIQQGPNSPMATGGSSISLPSIAASLANIGGDVPSYAHSPPGPGRILPPFNSISSHGSPQSPIDTFRRELPSPGRAFYPYNNHRRPSNPEGVQYSSAGDYSSSNTETPSTIESAPTPAIDRMSIDGITNPQIGGFICVYPGCNAAPFQTQYLLNSHANVHSSNRPHYCSVKGCPRSEGGKGFKRKNEMIRHGLVHDSPGYVCPFCPDREHKYPRPDNLQRHVRVHHVDKDKDDIQLRDVLAQRPEGPSRGRRRRGGTT